MNKYCKQREDGIIYIDVPEVENYSEYKTMLDEYSALVNNIIPAKVYFDGQNLKGLPSKDAQELVKEELKKVRDYDYRDKVVFVIEINTFLKIILQSVLSISGYTHVKIMHNKEEAFKYLNS